MRLLIILILIVFVYPSNCKAQKEALVWPFGLGKQINFQTGNFVLSDFNGNLGAVATICDSMGNLVLSTDGETVWNASNGMLINGNRLLESDETPISKPVFVPYPKKEGWYILLYESAPRGGYSLSEKKLCYAEIDATANNGQGEVITHGIKIHDNYHYTFTLCGYCNNSYYWIAIDRNENVNQDIKRDRIYFYRIDENGVSLQPKINGRFNIGNSAGYKFSPNGDKLFFLYEENSPPHRMWNMLADFNYLTGELYNFRKIDIDLFYPVEFSPDSRFMYFISNDSILCQIDARYTSYSKLNKNITQIVDFSDFINSKVNLYNAQLGPDGKIYFIYYERENEINKLGRINNPNTYGVGCDVELDIIPIKNLNRLPSFVTSFFRDKSPKLLDEQMANAGPDIEICSFSNAKIGTESYNDALYNWFPDDNIEDPFTSTTNFVSTSPVEIPDRMREIVRVTDGNCWINFDSMIVSVLPVPDEPVVDGSWSLCPYVEKVDYWIMENDPTLQWLIDGGEIVDGNSADSVKVNWGNTNFNASVNAVVSNVYGCYDTAVFPVRINVELITETPNGPQNLCLADAKNITYKIKNTNGSVYEWIAEGGEIMSGQGTNEVRVNWNEGHNKISVLETSRTIDTICYGGSEPLMVEILNDSLEIELINVSFNIDNSLKVEYALNKMNSEARELLLLAENQNNGLVDNYQAEIVNGNYLIYPSYPEETGTQIINLEITNLCNEIFYSNAQQTVVLNGEVLYDELIVLLKWNLNQFWETDRLQHEIWYSETGINNWKLITTIYEQTTYDYNYQKASPNNYFKVKEINLDRNLESWSNTINVEIDDDLLIPDVFTPNGDGFNDTWEIRNIMFHPFKSLMIYNRLGKPVYECYNEFVPWDGKIDGNIIQGTFFYKIVFEGNHLRYGQVTVLQ